MNNYYIYSLRSPDSEMIRYIGITFNPNKRLREHLCEKTLSYKSKWIQSLKLNGVVPVMDIIEDDLTEVEAKSKEIQYILLFKSFGARLTNISTGGESSNGHKCSDEAKLKMRLKKLGKKLSDEHKNKLRIKSTGKKHTEEAHTEEAKAKMRLKRSEQILSPRAIERLSYYARNKSAETRLKISKAHLGKKHTEEHKKKISQGLMGRTVPENTRNKISASQPNRKEVAQFDLNGILVRTWESKNELRRNGFVDTVGIAKCCLGKKGKYKKFIWKHRVDLLPVPVSFYKKINI